MATDDRQILVTGQGPVPAFALIPGNGQIKPKAMNAIFDGTNAAGDFMPTLEIVSDAGIVVARVAAATVTAGDKAEVTWAPFLRAPQAGFPGLTSGSVWATVFNQVIPSGVVTDVTLDSYTVAEGTQGPFKLDAFGAPVQPLVLIEFRVWVQLSITWPAGAYDRYIEFDPAGDVLGNGAIHVRARGSVTPDDDIQVIQSVEGEDLTPPALLNMKCFQASGVNKTVNGQFVGYGWPRVLGQGYVG